MIITREAINKDIVFEDLVRNSSGAFTKIEYTFTDLSKLIDVCKNTIQRHGAVTGESVLIGELAGMMQTALVFACAELGLTINIIDHNRPDHWTNKEYIDPKTKLLMPIDYYLINDKDPVLTEMKNFKIFKNVCNKIISVSTESKDTTPNHYVGATENSTLIKCTTSGTTGISKIITHTHGFMKSLIKRNSTFFNGSVFLLYNLNHGSSPATYFFPSLASENTQKMISSSLHDVVSYATGDPEIRPEARELFNKDVKFNHLMIPYPVIVEPFLESGEYPDTIVYTLTAIKEDWLCYLKEKKIKDVISIFGSNETSGPIFINKLSDSNFSPHEYYPIDDFYKIELVEREYLEKIQKRDLLQVTLPVYGKKVVTNDLFDLVDGNRFYHKGRGDLFRVNGVEVPVDYQSFINSKILGDLIIDTINNALYLAVWDSRNNTEELVREIDTEIKRISSGAHSIAKYEFLNYNDFISGVKLDQEILRDYFRTGKSRYKK